MKGHHAERTLVLPTDSPRTEHLCVNVDGARASVRLVKW